MPRCFGKFTGTKNAPAEYNMTKYYDEIIRQNNIARLYDEIIWRDDMANGRLLKACGSRRRLLATGGDLRGLAETCGDLRGLVGTCGVSKNKLFLKLPIKSFLKLPIGKATTPHSSPMATPSRRDCLWAATRREKPPKGKAMSNARPQREVCIIGKKNF